jgi:hypothetical protein
LSFKLDMEAAARVARRVQLADIRLSDLSLKLTAQGDGASMAADVKRNCIPLKWDGGIVEVSCNFHFRASDAETQVAYIDATYVLRYTVDGSDPITELDAKHFAYANGAYNSWPFARELFHSLSTRMSLPPFTLPVLSFAPPKPKTKEPKALPPAPLPLVPAGLKL